MVRTKCQPKSWDRQNANHRNKSGQNANLWLALCPVGILSSWHFVRTPFTIPSQQSHMQPLPNAMKLFIAARENISTAVLFIHKPINTSLLCSKFLVVRFSKNVSPFQIFLVNIGLVRGCSRYVSLWLAVLVNFGRLCCLF